MRDLVDAYALSWEGPMAPLDADDLELTTAADRPNPEEFLRLLQDTADRLQQTQTRLVWNWETHQWEWRD